MKYTVLLLYPDYIATDYGSETYTTVIDADSIEEAIYNAQIEAKQANQVDYEAQRDFFNAFDPDDNIDPEDFTALGVFEGDHHNLAPF